MTDLRHLAELAKHLLIVTDFEPKAHLHYKKTVAMQVLKF
jgi:hypothetical protein